MDFRDVREFFIDAMKYIIVIVIVLLIGIFVVSFQQVVGPSMSGTLEEGNIILVNKMIYKFSKPKRGDIVTLSVKEKVMVKRVIGLPGETIAYKDNILYVNDVPYEDTYANSDTGDFTLQDLGYEVIPEGYYLVLGDNRANSQDSRNYGLISIDEIIGRVTFRLYPFNKMKIF